MSKSTGSPGGSQLSADRVAAPAGFTLVEVVVAFLIAAVVLGTLFPLLRNVSGDARRAEAQVRATLWAESLLEAMAPSELQTPGERQGATTDGYRWQTSVRPVPDASGSTRGEARMDMAEVTVTVLWRAGYRDQAFSLSTLRLVPGSGP